MGAGQTTSYISCQVTCEGGEAFRAVCYDNDVR
jgi:hypothetical protein